MTCTNDLTPIIVAIAAQITLLGAAIVGWIRYKTDVSKSKERQYKMLVQNDKLLYIIENGFHGPAGRPGPAGPAGPPGELPPAPKGQQD